VVLLLKVQELTDAAQRGNAAEIEHAKWLQQP
jgi:hypothetical protein